MTGFKNTFTTSVEAPKRTERKIKKCLVEKKRRERMERSLEAMKTIVLESLGKNPADYEKMEKADLLDLVVKVMLTTRQRAVMASHSYAAHTLPTSPLSVQVSPVPLVARVNVAPRPAPAFMRPAPRCYVPNAAHAYAMTSRVAISTAAPASKPSGGEMWRPW